MGRTVWNQSLRSEATGDLAAVDQRIGALYDKADWEGAYREAERAVLAFPKYVSLRVTAAALLGDWGETFTGGERRRRKAAAVRELRAWARHPPIRLRPELRDYACNELYYHSGAWKRQALLGARRVRSGESRANYSLGVGAACHGAELLRRGLVVNAQLWAEVATAAWQAYFATRGARDRFDTHAFHAIACAVLGRFDEAEAALEHVARLIGKDLRTTSIYDIEKRLAWCRRRYSQRLRG